MLPALTIAIPTYNRRDGVAALAASIVAQLLPGDELVVSDDGSTDGTAAALAAVPGVIVVRQPANLGMVGNWNFCLTAGTNDWVCLLHDDDRLLPGAVEAIRRACAMAGGPALIAHGEGLGLRQRPDGGFNLHVREAGSVAALEAEFCPSAVTIHRAIPAAVGGFAGEHRYSADMEYFARVCARFRSIIITNPRVLEYVLHADNYQLRTWQQPDFLERLSDVERASVAHAGLPAGDVARELDRRMTRDLMHMIRGANSAADRSTARRAATAMLRLSGLTRRQRLVARIVARLGRAPGRLIG